MKEPTGGKRAAPPRRFQTTSKFDKDWTRLSRAGRFDMARLKQAMILLIANDAALGPEWRDHPLAGDWQDHRDLHIHGDFLLIYRIEGDMVVFVRAGTHADLFE